LGNPLKKSEQDVFVYLSKLSLAVTLAFDKVSNNLLAGLVADAV
jgi:hypothetical protein